MRRHRHLSFSFGDAAIMTFNCSSINVPLSLFVVPLLVSGLPNLSFTTPAASEWLVEIEIRQVSVSVDVRKLAVVSWHSRWMALLLRRSEAQDSFGLANLCLGGISTGLYVTTHRACCRLTICQINFLSISIRFRQTCCNPALHMLFERIRAAQFQQIVPNLANILHFLSPIYSPIYPRKTAVPPKLSSSSPSPTSPPLPLTPPLSPNKSHPHQPPTPAPTAKPSHC